MSLTLNGTSGITSPGGDTSAGNNTISGNLLFNSGYGSAATAYGCRAWVNFNGTGTVAISASGNVSSITDNGVGVYTVNFATAMPDANYATLKISGSTGSLGTYSSDTPQTTTAVGIQDFNSSWNNVDSPYVCVACFR